jgi:hypothetical protein
VLQCGGCVFACGQRVRIRVAARPFRLVTIDLIPTLTLTPPTPTPNPNPNSQLLRDAKRLARSGASIARRERKYMQTPHRRGGMG